MRVVCIRIFVIYVPYFVKFVEIGLLTYVLECSSANIARQCSRELPFVPQYES